MVGEAGNDEDSDAPIDHKEFVRGLEAAGLEEPHYCHTEIFKVE